MIQCKDCEHYQQDEQGRRTFRCDPFVNIKEPECLMKWQLLRLDLLVSHYQTMLTMQQKLAPMQDKILKYVKKELDDIDEADRWKLDEPDEPDSPFPAV
ncbi:MAG: hypothetical protein LLF76_09575 [Planctomycetaceae bacterium]|nr:hypothetical protein [Planctomycetaceae bacterium]